MQCFCCCRSPFKTGQLRASRLSKAGFDFRYQKLAHETGNLHLIDQLETYADKKQAAAAYFTARAHLFDYLKTAQYGEWLARPDQLEAFTTESRWTSVNNQFCFCSFVHFSICFFAFFLLTVEKVVNRWHRCLARWCHECVRKRWFCIMFCLLVRVVLCNSALVLTASVFSFI